MIDEDGGAPFAVGIVIGVLATVLVVWAVAQFA
jgi:hypothetical protein